MFLLLNSVGYTVYAHYCDNELVDTSVILNNTSSCCEEENAIPVQEKGLMSCCKEKGTHVVIKDQFVKSEIKLVDIIQPLICLNLKDFLCSFSVNPNQYNINQRIDRPPIQIPPNLTILYSVFRI